jgi:hypothetical protein
VQGSQSAARLLPLQSQQLLTESQIFKDEVLSGPESADHPPEEMPDRRDHGKNRIGKALRQVIHFVNVRRFGETHRHCGDGPGL